MPTSKPAEHPAPARAPAEIRLDTRRGSLAGLRWAVPGGPRVLALHGWLDNAASFVPMAPHLAGLDVLALDLAGHGHSDHRPPLAHYYFTEYLFDIDVALDALGWDTCHFIGHSMGAAIASLYAASASERVQSLVMLDALGPLTGDPSDAAARLRRSLAHQRRPPRALKAYDSVEAMAAARTANADDLTAEAARLICERAARRDGDHYVWGTDPGLHWVSPTLMSEEQALDCLRHIEAPVLALTARPYARWAGEEQVRRRAGAIPHGLHEAVDGGHHFHMDQPAATGARIAQFIHGLAEP